jgi:hypothetical protein
MRKDFKRDNPALAFINAPAEKEKETQPAQGTQHTYHTDREDETRSKRLNLLLTPSLHANLTRIAQMERISLNELINVVLKAHEQQNQAAIERYKEIWEKNNGNY